MAEAKQSAFEGWAVVELMGHQREIGYVTTEAYGQAVMFRVDTPELPERAYELPAPEYTQPGNDPNLRSWTPAGSKVKRSAVPARSRLIAPGALYAINPCTEEVARAAMERVPRPLILVQVAFGKSLPAPEQNEDLFDDVEEELANGD